MIKNIIFDFGGVILKHKTSLINDILSAIFPQDLQKALEIQQQYSIPILTGQKTSLDFIQELKNSLPTKLTVDEIKQKWIDLYKKEANGVDWELLNFIKKLKEKYKVILFTDTIDVHDKYNKDRGIYEEFDEVYKSFEEKVAKKEGKKAFLYLLQKIKAQPDECVFVDDLATYVKTASELGMKGIVYKNRESLKEELANLGIVNS